MKGGVQHQTMWVFYIYAAQNNIMWRDTRGLHTFYCKIKKLLPWYASDPSFVGTREVVLLLVLE